MQRGSSEDTLTSKRTLTTVHIAVQRPTYLLLVTCRVRVHSLLGPSVQVKMASFTFTVYLLVPVSIEQRLSFPDDEEMAKLGCFHKE